MRFIDDDGKSAIAVHTSDVVEDERKFMDRRGDDFLSAVNEPTQVAGSGRCGVACAFFHRPAA